MGWEGFGFGGLSDTLVDYTLCVQRSGLFRYCALRLVVWQRKRRSYVAAVPFVLVLSYFAGAECSCPLSRELRTCCLPYRTVYYTVLADERAGSSPKYDRFVGE